MAFFKKSKVIKPPKEEKHYPRMTITLTYISAFIVVGLALGLDIWGLVRAHSDHTTLTMDVRDINPKSVFLPAFEKAGYVPEYRLTVNDTSLKDLYTVTSQGYQAYSYTCIESFCYPFYDYTARLKNAYEGFPSKVLFNEASPLLNGSVDITSMRYVAPHSDIDVISRFVQEVMSTEKIMRIVSISCTGTLILVMSVCYLVSVCTFESDITYGVLLLSAVLNEIKAITIAIWQYVVGTPAQKQLVRYFEDNYSSWGLGITASRYDKTSVYISIAVLFLSLSAAWFNLITSVTVQEVAKEEKSRKMNSSSKETSQGIEHLTV